MPKDQLFIYELQSSGIRYRISLVPSLRVYIADVDRENARYSCECLNAIGRICPQRTATEVWNFVMGDNQTD